MDDQESSLPIGMIVGFVVGAAVIIFLVAVGFFMFWAVDTPVGAPPAAVVAVAAPAGPPAEAAPEADPARARLLGVWEAKTADGSRATLTFRPDGTLDAAIARPGQDQEPRIAIRWEILAADGDRVTVRRTPPDRPAQEQVFLFENADRFTIQGEGGGAVYERKK